MLISFIELAIRKNASPPVSMVESSRDHSHRGTSVPACMLLRSGPYAASLRRARPHRQLTPAARALHSAYAQPMNRIPPNPCRLAHVIITVHRYLCILALWPRAYMIPPWLSGRQLRLARTKAEFDSRNLPLLFFLKIGFIFAKYVM